MLQRSFYFSKSFWHLPITQLFSELHSSDTGLSEQQAKKRRKGYRKKGKKESVFGQLLSQFTSPLLLLLLGSALLSALLQGYGDSLLIFLIVLASGLLSFSQEYRASNALKKLLKKVEVEVQTLRSGVVSSCPLSRVVPGDIIVLNAGDVLPGDARLLEANDLFVDESLLTGESLAVQKVPGVLALSTPMAKRSNSLFMGSHVVSGYGKALVVATGDLTEYGKIAEHLRMRPVETAFEQGLRHFGFFIMEVTFLLLFAIFVVNMALMRPWLDSLLFSLALAVGLTPQLLPAVVSINLSHGARKMARHHVIVRKLSSIVNFGQMNVLCADKTGTLTEGRMELKKAVDTLGSESRVVHLYGYLNALFQAGYTNPIDEALIEKTLVEASSYRKLGEIPYDFVRKRMSVLVEAEEGALLITKGSFAQVLSCCRDVDRSSCEKQFEGYAKEGYYPLALAYRAGKEMVEKEMTFAGFLLFSAPLKMGISATIQRLKEMGIQIKMVTGDNRYVAGAVGSSIGLDGNAVLTGEKLQSMSESALMNVVKESAIFAEVEPSQKERIILALKRSGHVVGYIGDGINDVSAMHAADVGIAVESAADVLKEASDMVLMERDLKRLEEGVKEGRKSFANTMKYVFMATSANFGNMFSVAIASVFLNFLPLLPKQILFTNLLTDCPEMAISTDRVDKDILKAPVKWDISFIRKFMLSFGFISSFYDLLTFAYLSYVEVSREEFRTAWMMESVISASLIVLVIRSKKPFLKKGPSKLLLFSVVAIISLTLILPYLPGAAFLSLTPLSASLYAAILGIVLLYILTAEAAKRYFYR